MDGVLTIKLEGRVADDCSQCRDLYAYTILAGDIPTRTVARVWQEREDEGHPDGPHFGVIWKAALADGTPVTGPWSRHRDADGDTFCSRAWAIEQIRRALARAA
jgi:hypothetical protein